MGGFFLGGGRGRGLQAGVDFNFAQTGLAFDRATPVEFAHAALGPSLAMALVAAVAAQQVAAVDRLRRLNGRQTKKNGSVKLGRHPRRESQGTSQAY